MKKSLLILFILSSFLYISGYSQAPLPVTNPNFLHDKLMDFMVKSQSAVSLPDSVTKILINYARNKNLEYQLVLRNSYMFKVLYNESLSIEDRLFANKYYIEANSGLYQYAPLYFLKQLQNSLIIRK